MSVSVHSPSHPALRAATNAKGANDVLALQRLLRVSQAVEEGLTILTPDAAVARYPVAVLW